MSLKQIVRPIAAAVLVLVLEGMWVYQTFQGEAPDTMLSLIVFLSAIVGLVYLFGKGTVSSSVSILKDLQGNGDDK